MHTSERWSDDEQSHSFMCDAPKCNADFSDIGDFKEVWADAKDAGWICRLEEEEWIHFCPMHKGKIE
jgi:hypothetical protein